jgi:hypothetical protein
LHYPLQVLPATLEFLTEAQWQEIKTIRPPEPFGPLQAPRNWRHYRQPIVARPAHIPETTPEQQARWDAHSSRALRRAAASQVSNLYHHFRSRVGALRENNVDALCHYARHEIRSTYDDYIQWEIYGTPYGSNEEDTQDSPP